MIHILPGDTKTGCIRVPIPDEVNSVWFPSTDTFNTGAFKNLHTQGETDVPRYVRRVTRGEGVFNENYLDSFFIK